MPTVMMVGFALGLSWAFLPGGLEFDPVARERFTSSGEGSGTFALQWMPLILLGIVGIFLRFRAATLLLRDLNPWGLLIPLWAMASLLWAADPFTVFKQSVGIAGVVLLAWGFVLHGWHPQRFVTVIRPLVTVALAASLVVGLLMPHIGVHAEQQFELNGSWRGITYQKNGLGQLSATGIILWFHAWASRSVRLPVSLAGMALSMLMILLSRSSTSLLLSIICCGLIFLQLRPPLRLGANGPMVTAASWLMLLAPLVGYAILVGAVDSEGIAQSFGSIFGKDASFSGRTYIWAELMDQIAKHPWAGVGYNSFWSTPLAAEAKRRLGWSVPSGHNGYLDMWNTLGLVGISMLVMMLMRGFADIARLRRIDPANASLHFGLLLYSTLANLTESGWFIPMAYTHVIVVYSSITVSRLLFDARLRSVAVQTALQHSPGPFSSARPPNRSP